MKRLLKWVAFLSAVILSVITFSSCNIRSSDHSKGNLQQAPTSSALQKCPYKTVILANSYRIDYSSVPQITDQASVDIIYNLMQPNKWEKLNEDLGIHMEAVTLYFDDSDADKYVYEVYNDGYVFFVHNVKSAKAKILPDGTSVQGEYAYYKIPENVYQDLNNYFQSKYGNNS